MEVKSDKKQFRRYFDSWREVRWDIKINNFDFRLLREIADCQGKNTHTWISQATLGQRLHRSREHINRRIASLEKENLLRISGKRHKKTLKMALRRDLSITPCVTGIPHDPVTGTSHKRTQLNELKEQQDAVDEKKDPLREEKLASLIRRSTEWAFGRASVRPNCTEEQFKSSVEKTFGVVGSGPIEKLLERGSNAITFLTRCKELRGSD